jgi:hypothetical protein
MRQGKSTTVAVRESSARVRASATKGASELLSTAAQRLALLGHSGARVSRPRPLDGTRPLVSVVIPCYNYGHYLPGCVASVLEQPGVDLDVVIVDDASPDGSAGTVRRLVAGDPRLRAIYHERNQGHIATYNDGLATAHGEYVLLLSADDLLVPGALGRAVALMEAHPSVGLVYGATVDFTATPPPARTLATSWVVWQGQDWLAGRCRSGRNPLLSPEAVMRTSVLHKLGGYRADLPHAADFAMWLGAATVSDIGYVGGADQAYYRVHAQSMSKTVNAGMVIDIQQRLRTFDVALRGDDTRSRVAWPGAAQSGVAQSDVAQPGAAQSGVRSGARADLLAAAHRALARQALEHAIAACAGATDGPAAAGPATHGPTADGPATHGPTAAGSAAAGPAAGPALNGAGADIYALVDALVDVALTADPRAYELAQWRVLQQIRDLTGEALRRSPSFRARQLTHDLTDRVRWRRWRQVGV